MERLLLFLAFAESLRRGDFHDGRPVTGAEVTRALRECAQFMVANGLADPRRQTPSDHCLDPTLANYLKSLQASDPPPLPQQALPSSTIRWIVNTLGQHPSPRCRITAHLICLAFFFLLRVGEYTPSPPGRRTVPLRKQDIRLWCYGTLLDNDADIQTLSTADAVTICLENQKNGHKHAVLHHTTSRDASLDPVRSAVVLVDALRGLPPTTPIGSFLLNGTIYQATATDIRSTIRLAAINDNLQAAGYDIQRIGSHSVRSGGAMHLKLAGYDHDIIQKLGRWSSPTYLHYIQSQIGQLTTGVAERMASVNLRFHLVS
jgi:hypothetical protein